MEFLLNERSLHGQYHSVSEFAAAIAVLMEMRIAIKRSGRELYCNKQLSSCRAVGDAMMSESVHQLDIDSRRAWMQWLTKGGPFWLDKREHPEDEMFEVNDDVVTDTALGEAAFCISNGISRELVSFAPSNWEFSPISVRWTKTAESSEDIFVNNHWQFTPLGSYLDSLPKPFDSWGSIESFLRVSSTELLLPDDFFRMEGYPYVRSVAEGICSLFGVLEDLARNVDSDGKRNEKYHITYHTYFEGASP